MISKVIPADNARLSPSQGDKLMRLPSQTIGKEELLRSMSVAEEGPEEMMDAEDYLQPTSSAAPPPPAANGSVVGKVSIVSTVCMGKGQLSRGFRGNPKYFGFNPWYAACLIQLKEKC